VKGKRGDSLGHLQVSEGKKKFTCAGQQIHCVFVVSCVCLNFNLQDRIVSCCLSMLLQIYIKEVGDILKMDYASSLKDPVLCLGGPLDNRIEQEMANIMGLTMGKASSLDNKGMF
jgi:hypothetical protein